MQEGWCFSFHILFALPLELHESVTIQSTEIELQRLQKLASVWDIRAGAENPKDCKMYICYVVGNMSANEASIHESTCYNTWSCCALCQVGLKDVHRHFGQWQSDLQCYTTIWVHVCAGLIRLKKEIKETEIIWATNQAMNWAINWATYWAKNRATGLRIELQTCKLNYKLNYKPS